MNAIGTTGYYQKPQIIFNLTRDAQGNQLLSVHELLVIDCLLRHENRSRKQGKDFVCTAQQIADYTGFSKRTVESWITNLHKKIQAGIVPYLKTWRAAKKDKSNSTETYSWYRFDYTVLMPQAKHSDSEVDELFPT